MLVPHISKLSMLYEEGQFNVSSKQNRIEDFQVVILGREEEIFM